MNETLIDHAIRYSRQFPKCIAFHVMEFARNDEQMQWLTEILPCEH